MPNNIAANKNYTTILDRVYQRGGDELVPELARSHGDLDPAFRTPRLIVK